MVVYGIQNNVPSEPSEAGIFTWNVEHDMIFGDSAVARLFGLAVEDALSGQQINTYLQRIHPDDLPEVAAEIRDAIVTGAPYRCQYRVRGAGDVYRNVEAFGRCFRSREGEPIQYAGIIYPFEAVATDKDPLVDACALALRIARDTGRKEIAAKLAVVALALSP